MKTRRLGALEVSALGFGTMSFASRYGESPGEAEAIRVIRGAYDLGITLFDTAEAYGPFTNEILVGKALAPIRNQVTIATKFGWNIDPETGTRGPGVNSRPAHIRKAVEGMLRRLNIATIDLLYQHRVDPAVPIEEVAGTIKDLITAGKVRYYGLCEAGAETIRRAHAVHPLTAVQSEYSVWTREPEPAVLPLCEQLGIGFVPWSPLGQGFLAGKINAATRFEPEDFRNGFARFSPEARAANAGVVELLARVAEARQATSAQVALAWLLARKPFIVPIPGTRSLDRLEENLGAAELKMSETDIEAIDTAMAGIEVSGERLPQSVLQYSYI